MANRYDITNKQNGLKFSYIADTPKAAQPEWGQNPDIVVTDVTQEVTNQKAQEAQKKAALAKLKSFDENTITTLADVVSILKDVIKYIR